MSDDLQETTQTPAQEATPATTQEFKNEHITVEVEKKPHCQFKFQIIVSPEASKAAYAKAVKAVSKEVSLPGFRKGKSPTELIQKKFGVHIDKEWKDILLQTAVDDSLKLTEMRPFGRNFKANLVKFSKDEPSKAIFEFEARPNIPEIKTEEIKIDVVYAAEVTDEDVAAELHKLQLQQAKWEKLNDRPAEKNDYVILNMESLDTPPDQFCEDQRFNLGAESTSAWIKTHVVGMKPGESKEIKKQYSDDEARHETYSKLSPSEQIDPPIDCKVTLNSISKPNMPELDDAFCKSIGAGSYENLTQKVRRQLEINETGKAWQIMQNQVTEQLLMNYPFDIPASSYSGERDHRMKSIQDLLGQGNTSSAMKFAAQKAFQYISNLPARYHLYFLAQRFADKHNIRITQQELVDEINHYLLLSQAHYDAPIDLNMEPELARNIVYNTTLLDKVLSHIVQNAQQS